MDKTYFLFCFIIIITSNTICKCIIAINVCADGYAYSGNSICDGNFCFYLKKFYFSLSLSLFPLIYLSLKSIHLLFFLECGVSDYPNNLKLLGGIDAVTSSWPYHALIVQNYKTNYTFPDNNSLVITKSFHCGGTLINRFTVLTSLTCSRTSFNYNYSGVTYTININVNESMFTVYLGLNDTQFLSGSGLSVPYPGAKFDISEIIAVS